MPRVPRTAARPSGMSLALGEVLRVRREQQEITQAELAELAGVSEATLQRLERGRWPTDPLTLESVIASYSQVSREPVPVPLIWNEAARLALTWGADPTLVPDRVRRFAGR